MTETLAAKTLRETREHEAASAAVKKSEQDAKDAEKRQAREEALVASVERVGDHIDAIAVEMTSWPMGAVHDGIVDTIAAKLTNLVNEAKEHRNAKR